MRRILILTILIVILLSVLVSCKLKAPGEKVKPNIITTIYPYELLTRQLVDTLFTVETLLPDNASPHTWSPAPQDIMKLQKADVIIANGLGLETNLEKTLAKTGSKLITVSDFIKKDKLIYFDNESEHTPEGEEEHKHEGANPHIWTSPELLTDIVIELSEELARRYPMHKTALEQNARLIIMELFQVESKIRSERNEFENPAVITLHDAFVYFLQYFDIEHIGSVQPAAGKDPAPQQLKNLADKIKSKGIKAIFIEPQMNPRPAEVLAAELGLKVLQYDDLGTVSGAETIADYLCNNWDVFKAGL
ncbi:MAG: metal ABC transporter substrate-binding protein [Candidatus Cloacimonadaceae bacterium]